jgi:hypothetical protein
MEDLADNCLMSAVGRLERTADTHTAGVENMRRPWKLSVRIESFRRRGQKQKPGRRKGQVRKTREGRGSVDQCLV